LGHPSKFQRVSRLGLVTAATSLTGGQPNLAPCLAVSWAGILYIHVGGLLLPDGILLGANFTLRPSVAFLPTSATCPLPPSPPIHQRRWTTPLYQLISVFRACLRSWCGVHTCQHEINWYTPERRPIQRQRTRTKPWSSESTMC